MIRKAAIEVFSVLPDMLLDDQAPAAGENLLLAHPLAPVRDGPAMYTINPEKHHHTVIATFHGKFSSQEGGDAWADTELRSNEVLVAFRLLHLRRRLRSLRCRAG